MQRTKTVHLVRSRNFDQIETENTAKGLTRVPKPKIEDIEKGDHIIFRQKGNVDRVRIIMQVGESYIWVSKIESK